MDKILYIHYDNNKNELLEEKPDIDSLDIKLLYDEEKGNLISGHEIETFYDKVCEIIAQKNINNLFIDYNLDSFNPFAIAAHIRLTGKIKDLPVFIISKSPVLLKDHTKPDFNLPKLNAVILETARTLLMQDSFGEPKHKELSSKFKREFNYGTFLSQLKIDKPETTTRHQIANEWGAFKLAYEAGFDISYSMPQTLYFKYLKAKYGISEKKPEKQTIFETKKLKVLLIDDNADKGWKEAIEKILPADVEVRKDIREVLEIDVTSLGNYDLIFLDLYMPYRKEAINSDLNTEGAKKILQTLKKLNPAISIIIFTASNKVWNLQKLYELGADGYFVKESPENASIKNFSKDNFETFKQTVLNAYNKGIFLKPYWTGIQFIRNNLIDEISDFKEGKYEKKIKSRVEERLKMFFGLLKRGFEQNEFNKEHFYYSDYELAFITLWSLLNEIQEAYYQKYFPDEQLKIKDGEKTVTKHPNGTEITPIPGYNWRIRNQEDYLIKYEFKIKGKDDKGYYILKPESFESKLGIKNDEPYYEIVGNSNNKNLWRELANQMAFLILRKKELKDKECREKMLIYLKKLNDIRNHLYLTHGDEVTKGFYVETEELKRENDKSNVTKERIRDLFKLVAFLLTGKLKELELQEPFFKK